MAASWHHSHSPILGCWNHVKDTPHIVTRVKDEQPQKKVGQDLCGKCYKETHFLLAEKGEKVKEDSHPPYTPVFPRFG